MIALRPKMKTPGLQSKLTPYLFLAPFFFVFGVFTVYPLFVSVILSLQQTFGAEYSQWVYFSNFINLLSDPLFWTALRNTVIYATASLCIQLPLSLALALLLNQPWLKGKVWWRLIFFSPALVGTVFVAILFRIILQQRVGLLNIALNKLFGLNPDFPWLQEHVMISLIICSLWMWVGFNMIYFLAALQAIDDDLVNAARIDGAGSWQRFWHITLPSIRPVAGFVVLLSLIGSFQLFELPWLLFDATAGPNFEGLTVVMYLYQNGFEMGDLGYASAIGWVLAVILICLTTAQRFYLKNREQN